jgi:hypothetical protein
MINLSLRESPLAMRLAKWLFLLHSAAIVTLLTHTFRSTFYLFKNKVISQLTFLEASTAVKQHQPGPS